MPEIPDYKQVCDTQGSTEGPFKHVLFLGLSVQNVSASMGWNSQQSTITINLVEDDCPPPEGEYKYYYPKPGVEKRWSEPDPGWTNPTIGAPCYFRLGDFEFAGLLQNWEKKHGSGGFTYTVTLCDPRLLLENVSVIISDYADSIDGGVSPDTMAVENLINAYGFAEANGFPCSQQLIKGASFGSPAGGFGGSYNNNEGTPYNIIKNAIMYLLGQKNPVQNHVGGVLKTFSAGNARFRGHDPQQFTSGGGMGALEPDSFDARLISQFGHNGYIGAYYVDISEIPFAPTYFRLAGPQDTLMNIVSNACSLSGCDFFVELLLTPVGKIIKIRTTQRRVQPTLGEIEAFVATTDGVTEKNIGRELRNETNSSFLYGGYIQSIYEDLTANPIAGTDIIQHWGFDASGNFTPATLDADKEWDVTVDLRPLLDGLMTPLVKAGGGPAKKAVVSEREMRCALGEYDTWINYILAFNNKAGTELGNIIRATFPGVAMDIDPGPLGELQDAIPGANGMGMMALAGLEKKDPARQKLTSEDNDDLKKIHKFIADFADEYYGKQFLIRLPFVCYRDDEESGQRMLSDNPTNDGGWPAALEREDEDDPSSLMVTKTGILGLAWPPTNVLPELETFRDDMGKVHSFVKYDAAPTGAYPQNHEDFVVMNSGLYMKSQLDEKVYQYTDGNACAVIKLNQAIAPKKNEQGVDKRLAGLIEIADQVGIPAKANKAKAAIKHWVDKDQAGIRGDSALAMESKRLVPSGAAVPMISNTDRYGPYFKEGPPGQVKFESVDGLTPWNYNGYTAMDLAGAELVNDSVTFMQVGEKGALTLPGYPTMRLGQELRDSSTVNPNFQFGMFNNITTDINYGLKIFTGTESHEYVVYGFDYINSQSMEGTFGPNITDISINMGTNGVTTSYTFRTFSPTFGKFAKYNANQLQKVSKRRQQIARRNRLDDKINKRLAKAEQRVNKALANIKRENDAKNVGDGAAEVINAQQNVPPAGKAPDGGPVVLPEQDEGMSTYDGAASTSRQMANCTPDESGAFMSWDGLILPVSKSGDGGLSPYVTPTGTCSDLPGTTYQMDPPITGYTEPIVNTHYLDPFAVVSTPKHVASGNLSGNHNHVKRLAHSDYSNTGGTQTNMRLNELAGSGFPEDFRFLALKGPLLIHGWGYDLEGKPIPNRKDTVTNASNGIFTSGDAQGGLKDEFLPKWLRKPQTWPTAPLDVRFDRGRGVWTVPNDFRIMQAKVVESGGIPAGAKGAIQILNLRNTWDENGDLIIDEKQKRGILSNPATIDCIGTLASGDTFFTFYDTIDCLYYPIPCGSGSKGCTTIYNSGCDNQCTGDAGAELDCVGSNDDPYVYVYGTGITASFVQLSGLTGCGDCETGNITGTMLTGVYPDTGLMTALTGIMINLDLKASDSGYCDWSGSGADGNLLDCYNFDHIIFRSGLQATTGAECEVIVDADHYIYDSGYCDWSGNSGELVGGFFNALVAGSGLKVASSGSGNGSGSCTYVIHADHYLKAADNTGCLSGDSNVTDYEFFNKLAFRSGLTVNTGEPCEYFIDSIPHRIADSGYCEYTGISVPITGCTPFECVTFRSGLKVVPTEDDCDFLIDADHTLSKITCTGDAEIIAPTFFNHLTFYTGIDVELDSENNCNYLISSALTIQDIEHSGACTGIVPTVTEPVKYEALRFGSGLSVTGTGCEYTINARQACISDSGYCDWAEPELTVTECEIFEKITARSGLKVSKLDDCSYLIDADHAISDTAWCGLTKDTDREFFNHLTFDTGLVVFQEDDDGGCHFRIAAEHKLSDYDYCDYNGIIDNQFFKHIGFGNGLFVIEEADCDYTIHADHYIMDSGYCDYVPADPVQGDKRFFDTLIAGTGLKVEELGEGNCDYLIHADHYIKDVTGVCDTDAPTVADFEFFNKLSFRTGLTVTKDTDCTYFIDSTPFQIKDNDYCGHWPGVTGCSDVLCLEAGTGLQVVDLGDCNYRINADHYIMGTDYCDHTQAVGTFKFFNRLNFDRGLQVTDDGACSYTIKADHYIKGIDYCDHDGGVDAFEFFNKLSFDRGLQVTDDGDCAYTIKADHYIKGTDYCDHTQAVGAYGFFNKLNFDRGLQVSKTAGGAANCEYTIKADHYIKDLDYCNWSASVGQAPNASPQFFTNLELGTGLRAVFGNDVCTVKIDADHYITDTSYCDHTATITDDFFTNLNFGTGLKVNKQGGAGCQYNIDADHYITATGGSLGGPNCAGSDSVTKKFFNHLKIGSGLGVRQDGCEFEIFACGSGGSGNVQVKDSGYCDWTPSITSCTDVSCIIYGSGLKLVSISDGEGRVDADHYIRDEDYCGYTNTDPVGLGYKFFTKLRAGTGLKIHSIADCEYRINADHSLSSTGADCSSSESHNNVFFNNLTFTSGMGVKKHDDCSYEIYSCGSLEVKDSAECYGDYTPVVTTCSGLTCLEFGSGLHIYDAGPQPKVMAFQQAVNTYDSSCPTPAHMRQWFETLHFRSGISAISSGACDVIVDVDYHKYGGTATCAQWSAAGALGLNDPLSTVFAGPGIAMKKDNDNCGEYAVATDFAFVACGVGFTRPVEQFNYGCGIKVEPTVGEDCQVDISLDPNCNGAPVTGVRVVKDVCCTGDALTINYVTLRFNSCGLFTGIINDDGLCECCD